MLPHATETVVGIYVGIHQRGMIGAYFPAQAAWKWVDEVEAGSIDEMPRAMETLMDHLVNLYLGKQFGVLKGVDIRRN